jgi:hypothetical protein
MRQHPLIQCISKWFGFGLPDFLTLIRRQVFGFSLDLVKSADAFGLTGN